MDGGRTAAGILHFGLRASLIGMCENITKTLQETAGILQEEYVDFAKS